MNDLLSRPMTETSGYSDLLLRILSGIAHEPVTIQTEHIGSRRFNFKAYIDYRDMGLCLGGKGSCIKALQLIFRAIALKNRFVHFGVWLLSDTDKPHRWNKVKDGWDQEEALLIAYDLIEQLGHEISHDEVKQLANGCELIIAPELPEPILSCVHTVLETYGKSFGKVFGISF
jgi:predicted RNA-binding protein YlqC (UPF0109 family)